MKNTTRKHIWPMSLVMGLAVIGALAVIVALTALPGSAQAQEPENPFAAPPAVIPDAGSIASSSTTGGSSVKITLTLDNPGALDLGSSVALYLEDDYQIEDIDMDQVYFVGRPGTGIGRVYVTDAILVEDDDHFGGDDDWDIQVFVPDPNPDNEEREGWTAEQSMGIQLVLDKAGIKNPTEQGSHSAHYDVLLPGASVPTLDNPGADERNLQDLKTWAKISLSDEADGRGKEIVVTGTGFNNGTGAEVFVLVADAEPASCRDLVTHPDAESLGTALVGSDDKFTVTFTVHQDEFDPGPVNYICAADSETEPRFSSDIDVFDLEGSLTVSPDSASYGDEITLKPRDVGTVNLIRVGPRHAWSPDGTCPADATCNFDVEKEGSDYIFDLPGGLDERTQITVHASAGKETVYIGVEASSLDLSKSEVTANESIIIEGRGFDDAATIPVSMVTLDGEPLDVELAGTDTVNGQRVIQIDSNGRFVIEARVWTIGDGSNPALDDDTYTLKVVDSTGFEGEADLTIKSPTITVNPAVAGPRDYISISGENWPQSTEDRDWQVTIEVDGRIRTERIDTTGRFRHQVRLSSGIDLGEEHDVTVTFMHGDEDIEEDATFMTPDSGISVVPAAARPGDTISVELLGMPVYTLVGEVVIAGTNRLGNIAVNTDRDGNATVSGILVPAVDPGFYSVRVGVGGQTAVAQLEILTDAIGAGAATALPAAVSDLGDNLDAIFHFNNNTKDWTFFDPRPEFADLNTLSELVGGQPYWVLVKDAQTGVDWNGRLVDFTCAAGDCWNLEIW
ncbi:MAG: hypothetical protein F4X64_07175 [Chloroflexi bacterium]|nr:hypothetical protein [Chloroflexota bacterium]